MNYTLFDNRPGRMQIQPFELQKSTTQLHCNICHAESGKTCPVGDFVVKLKPVYIAGSEKHICQSCLHEHFEV